MNDEISNLSDTTVKAGSVKDHRGGKEALIMAIVVLMQGVCVDRYSPSPVELR